MLVAGSELPVSRSVCVRPSPLRDTKTVRGFVPVECAPHDRDALPIPVVIAPFQLGVGPLGLLRSVSVGVRLVRVHVAGWNSSWLLAR